jgi:NAD(P)-dependent dehydrogenase (short-subunit alcohol dehydrogenase family)
MSKLPANYDLTGKAALITGAAGLLGREHAAALVECGAHVVLTDLKADALEAARAALLGSLPGARVTCHVMDVTDRDSIRRVAGALAAAGMPIDILVNNAAIDPKDLQDWNLQLAVGLTGAFLCTQVFGAAMARGGRGGVILNIASDLSVIAPDQRLYARAGEGSQERSVKPVTYSVIKTGLVGFTRYLATYWADCGVRANSLSPGGVYNGQGEEFVSRISALIPLGRMARRDEYRSAVQFLCSDASSYLNGQNIVMDGGRSIW